MNGNKQKLMITLNNGNVNSVEDRLFYSYTAFCFYFARAFAKNATETHHFLVINRLVSHLTFLLIFFWRNGIEAKRKKNGPCIAPTIKKIFSWTQVVGGCNQYHMITSVKANSLITTSSHWINMGESKGGCVCVHVCMCMCVFGLKWWTNPDRK